jgi:hypothetical protein
LAEIASNHNSLELSIASNPLWISSGPSTDKMSIDFPKEEEEVLRRWREIKAFETQVELSKSRPLYTFYDGPPFAT